jgi:tetratricopeptide (TPR) repeat protein
MPPLLLPIAKPVDVPQTYAQAFKLHQQGHLAEAEQLCGAILAVRPDHFDALHMRGLIHLASGKLSEALRLIADAMRLRTPSPLILLNHGVVLDALGRHDEALESVNRAIKLKSRFSEAHSTRGAVLNALGRLEEALASLDRALTLRPNYPEAHYNRGIALEGLKRVDEALASYDRAIALQPGLVPAHSNRGGILSGLKRFDEALVSCDRAIALQPSLGQAHGNRGFALNGLKRFEEAIASFDRALAIRPNDAELHYNRALVLTALRRADEALASYDRAVSLRPDYAQAHLNDAMLKLLTGDFGRGWAKYEWRWKKESAAVAHSFQQPPWLGEDAISGKTILIHSEQGLGDTIQFCRYVPLVVARGAQVIFEVAKPLQKLMTGLAPTAQVISRGDPLPDFDVHCPLLSLPLAFGTRLETVPSDVPYLEAPSPSLTDWDARLGPKGRPRIGLVWSGNAMNERDKERSIGLRSFLPLLDVDATFVSLQKDVPAPDAALLRERGDILHVGDELGDFSDTAELISQLDLVISVDTSVAHLAGALGKPVWILVTHIPDWRWLLDREDSPWYPTARLFRQPRVDDWDSVITRVHDALREMDC